MTDKSGKSKCPIRRICCIVGCKNKWSKTGEIKFYSFPNRPWMREKRQKWIDLVKRTNRDGTPWMPTRNTVICSAHFVGNEKSEHPLSPSYLPTIFPDCYGVKPLTETEIAGLTKNQQTTLKRQVEELETICSRRKRVQTVRQETPKTVQVAKDLIDNCAAGLITIKCEDHHEKLINGLWGLLQSNVGVDFDVKWGQQSIRAHRFMLDMFLSPEKLNDSAERSSSIDNDSLLVFLYKGSVTVPKKRLGNLLQVAEESGFQMMMDAVDVATKKLKTAIKRTDGTQRGAKTAEAETISNNGRRRSGQPTNGISAPSTSSDFHRLRESSDQPTDERESSMTAGTQLPVNRVCKSVVKQQPARNNPSVAVGCQKRASIVTANKSESSLEKEVQCYECLICLKTFPTESQCSIHVQAMHAERPFECSVCTKMFPSDALRRAHEWKHMDGAGRASPRKQTEGCDPLVKCGEVTVKKVDGRDRSVKCVTGRMPNEDVATSDPGPSTGDDEVQCYECLICFKTFLTKRQCSMHRIKHAERPFKCELCGQAFRLDTQRLAHVARHADKKEFLCSECGKKFSSKGILNRHKLSHGTERRYQCDVCGARFTFAAHLKCHQVLHTGEKPHVCELCGRAFAQPRNLISHRLTHTDERPHACNVCGKRFRQRYHVLVHSRTHTGEKPYKCNLCDMACTTRCNLKVHQRTHAKDHKLHRCELCGKAFAWMHSLMIHLRTHRAANDELDPNS